MRKAAVALAATIALGGFGLGQAIARASSEPAQSSKISVKIPRCEEDEPYLLGKGDFDGERWARYVCVHVDELEG